MKKTTFLLLTSAITASCGLRLISIANMWVLRLGACSHVVLNPKSSHLVSLGLILLMAVPSDSTVRSPPAISFIQPTAIGNLSLCRRLTCSKNVRRGSHPHESVSFHLSRPIIRLKATCSYAFTVGSRFTAWQLTVTTSASPPSPKAPGSHGQRHRDCYSVRGRQIYIQRLTPGLSVIVRALHFAARLAWRRRRLSLVRFPCLCDFFHSWVLFNFSSTFGPVWSFDPVPS